MNEWKEGKGVGRKRYGLISMMQRITKAWFLFSKEGMAGTSLDTYR